MNIHTGLATLVLLATAVSPAAALSIDEFDGSVPVSSTPASFDGSMLGGERDMNPAANSTYALSGGELTFALVSGVSNLRVYYDGDDDDPYLDILGGGLGGIDLTAGGADRFLVSVTAVTSNPAFSLTIYSSINNSLSSGPLTITAPGIYEFTFASFGYPVGSASFSDVAAIQLTMSDYFISGGAGSLTLDYVRTSAGASSEVPEPASMALLGLGLVALGVWRRKQEPRPIR